MAEIVTMPKLGFDMAEGQLVSWVKKEGDSVEKGELLAEIETDKATVEVESNFSGVVRKHLVSAGDFVPVNNPIAVIGSADEEIDLDALTASAASAGDAAAAPAASEAQPAATETAPASSNGAPAPAPATPAIAAPAAAPSGATNGNLPGGVKASPLARNIAEDKGIDLRQVPGSGPGGRVIKRDVENWTPPAAAPAGAKTAPALSFPGLEKANAPVPGDQRVPLSKLRQAIGRRMVSAKQQAPHFYVAHEYDMAPVMALREQVNTVTASRGQKLSVNDFIVKAVALALREFPNLNASLDGDAILQHGHVNIGNAVSVEGGLLVVVAHDADRKSLWEISTEVRDKAGRARSGNIRPDDVDGSTFSISNLGMYDVEEFIAIINPPEAAILAVGSAAEVPVVKDGAIVPGWRMKATISVDHRVSDGAEAAQFMQALGRYLENPMSLML